MTTTAMFLTTCGISDDYNCYVPYDYVCDGVHDCPNGRDESKCGKSIVIFILKLITYMYCVHDCHT